MFRAERNGIAKAKRIAFQYPGFRRLALGLVDQQHDRRSGTSEPAGDFFVKRRETGTTIDHEYRQLRSRNRHFRLLAHPSGQALGVLVLITGRIDDVELETQQIGSALPPVARNPGRVVDQRQLLANQTVEQRGFADIWSTYDCNFGQHCASPVLLI